MAMIAPTCPQFFEKVNYLKLKLDNGWGPRDSAHKWLSTLEDMARDRCQWRSCCNFLIDLHDS